MKKLNHEIKFIENCIFFYILNLPYLKKVIVQ